MTHNQNVTVTARYVISVTVRRELYVGVTVDRTKEEVWPEIASAAKQALLLDLIEHPPIESDIQYNVITTRPDFPAAVEVTT